MNRYRLSRLFFVAIACLAIAPLACSDDSPSGLDDSLCAGKSGLGARITGGSETVDMCVPDDLVQGNVEMGVRTIFTSAERYLVTARATIDNTTFEIQLSFRHTPDVPATLNLTGNLAQAENDPDGVWLYYQEIPDGGAALESVNVTGVFQVSFSDRLITVGTLSGIVVELQKVSDQSDAGERSIPQGFFSISVDF
jgi:hypothetical protein